MVTARLSRLLAATAAFLVICGCGGGGGGGGADARDAITGTWAGPMTPSARAGGSARTITFQILKASDSGSIEGTFVVSISVAAPRSPKTRQFDPQSLFRQAGTFVGSYVNGQLAATLKTAIDASGLPLSTLAPFGTVALQLTQGAQASLNGTYTAASGETGTIAAAQVSSQATTPNLGLQGTSWSGNSQNGGGFHVQVPSLNVDKGTFPVDVTFASQGADNALSGTLTVTVPGGQSFPIPFSNGALVGGGVTISGTLPASAPPLDLGGGFSIPLAGAAFNFRAAVSGSTMGGPTSSGFSVQLPASLLSTAALLGYNIPADANNYVTVGTVLLTKTTVVTTGGIAVPIQ